MESKIFEKKIKPILLYMGTIVSVVMAIAYIVMVFVLIQGFKAETLLNTTLFSIITAIIGFCIMQTLKFQGQSFAANIEENIEIRKQYNNTKTKDKKARSLKYYWITSACSDIIVKCLTLGATSVGMVYIMIEGSQDWNLLLLAGVNLLMFAGFGLISLTKAYDYYNDVYVPYMRERIYEKQQQFKNTENVGVVKKEPTEQTNNNLYNDRRVDILESSDSNRSVGSSDKSTLLHSNGSNNCVLGRSIHTSSSTSNSINSVVEESVQQI